MAASASADQNQSVDARLNGFARMLDVDHIVKDQAAIAVDRANYVIRCAQTGDDDRHLVLHTHFYIVL